MSKHTPTPWTTTPGPFWICNIGNAADAPGIWSSAVPEPGKPYEHAEPEQDADYIAHACSANEALVELAWGVLMNHQKPEPAPRCECSLCRHARAALALGRGGHE